MHVAVEINFTNCSCFLCVSLPNKVKAGGAAVLSCPAYFSDAQRDVMAAAGRDAGLIVLDTIDEPVVSQQCLLSTLVKYSTLPSLSAVGLCLCLCVGVFRWCYDVRPARPVMVACLQSAE